MKKTSMFELLNERLSEEEIIKITTSYDNKFNELEEENKQLKDQLQQKESIIKEVREYIEQLLEYKKGKKISLDYVERILDILEQNLRY